MFCVTDLLFFFRLEIRLNKPFPEVPFTASPIHSGHKEQPAGTTCLCGASFCAKASACFVSLVCKIKGGAPLAEIGADVSLTTNSPLASMRSTNTTPATGVSAGVSKFAKSSTVIPGNLQQ